MNTNAELISSFNKLNVRQTLSVRDMIPVKDFHITGAERVTTKYGDTIVLELGTTMLYLPKRFNSLSDKDIEDLSTGEYLISKTLLNDDKDNSLYKLELKPVLPIRNCYSFSTFK